MKGQRSSSVEGIDNEEEGREIDLRGRCREMEMGVSVEDGIVGPDEESSRKGYVEDRLSISSPRKDVQAVVHPSDVLLGM